VRKLVLCFTVLLCLFAFAPVLADTASPVWKHKTEELLLSGSIVKDPATDHVNTDIAGAWLHYATDQSQIGVSTSLSRKGAEGGQGIGPAYYWNLPRLKKGNFFLGGSAEVLTGEVSDFAKAKAATDFGYRLYVGNSSALRVAAHLVKAINAESGAAADQIDSVGLVFGFSMGVSPGTTVQ